MFFLSVLAAAVAVTCVHAADSDITPGLYQIFNRNVTGGSLKSDRMYQTLYASTVPTNTTSPPATAWQVAQSGSGYTFGNSSFSGSASTENCEESPVITDNSEYATAFTIESVGDGYYAIKYPDTDLLWTVASAYGASPNTVTVKLMPTDGTYTQHWSFVGSETV
ncbi:uncharacterized protein BT62DRAFT_1005148 [Guyanagaster necrorhizus]|uniref:Uncharacterized protein n=1 Tax=Guyanagaster necrorhizus TaxID=856835 RepID=A0A9P8AUC5_9AGAR|nr:uncharacterized protein BT62DRAFT_1005148 [Guyanagaster necrorhizus MCA 3950]KAG7446767.1 hypothetical protein BT62DRAFT_1005148 [Guyanagaster necrorhizus MCA 3950]